MAIVSYDGDEVIEYTPEYMGNRDSDDPCEVGIKFITHGKVQKYSKQIANIAKGEMKNFAKASETVQKKQFSENVEWIKNFSAGGKEVTEAGEFYEVAPNALITEILQAMEDASKLSEGQLKNS
jgi:hypothetical protein